MKTYAPRPSDIERRWYVIDANDAVLGRLSSEVASILRGKHKPIYAPHADTGDHVIVVNASGVRLTGGKENKKVAYRHSGYPGGLTEVGYARLMAERPAFAVEKAVKGMLPKNRLGRSMITKLQVYEGAEHPHAAQQPQPLALGETPAWTGLPRQPQAPAGPSKVPASKPSTAKRPSTPSRKPSAAATKKPTAKATKKATAKKPSAAKKPAAVKKPPARKPAAKASTAKRSPTKPGSRRTKKEGDA